MKLEDYVKQTLLDITNGVVAAQEQSLVYVAPGFVDGERQSAPQNVTFEIGITVSKEGGGGLKVFAIGEASANVTAETVNKIRFEVPIYFQAPTERNPRHFSWNEKEE